MLKLDLMSFRSCDKTNNITTYKRDVFHLNVTCVFSVDSIFNPEAMSSVEIDRMRFDFGSRNRLQIRNGTFCAYI